MCTPAKLPYCDGDVAINVYRCHKYECPSEPKVYMSISFFFFQNRQFCPGFFLHRRFIKLYRKARQRKETVVSFASHMYVNSTPQSEQFTYV